MNVQSLESNAAETAQGGEERKQRESQNSRVIAFDGLEKMNAETFELVDADAVEHIRPCQIEIEINGILRQRAHGKMCAGDKVFDHLPTDGQSSGGVKIVASSRKSLQLRSRRFAIGRFMEDNPFAGENLIGPENDPLRMTPADRQRLLGGQTPRESRRIESLDPRGIFDVPLIDSGTLGFNGQTRADEKRKPGRARGGEKQIFRCGPEGRHENYSAMNRRR
jgi:hypothetical protein